MQASEQTGGIFDVTCAPLINLWGFGFTKFDSITPQLVDSIRHFVGFRKVRLQGNRVMKDDPRILLNFSVLGGGTICNIIACLFDRKGISNYMIDIGGEMIAKGKNPQGWNWCIGIVRPKDDSTGTNSELEQIVQLSERLGLRRESDKGSRFPVYGEQPVEQGVRLSFDNIHGEIGYYFLTVEG